MVEASVLELWRQSDESWHSAFMLAIAKGEFKDYGWFVTHLVVIHMIGFWSAPLPSLNSTCFPAIAARQLMLCPERLL